MKKNILILFLFFIASTSLFSQENQSNKKRELSRRKEILFQKGNLDKAIDKAEQNADNLKKIDKSSVSYALALVDLAELRKKRFNLLKKIGSGPDFNTQNLEFFFNVTKGDKEKIELLMNEVFEIYAKLPAGENLASASLKIEFAQFLTENPPIILAGEDIKKFFGKIETLYKQALATQEKLAGDDSDLTLKTVEILGDYYTAQVEFENALELYERYLKTLEKKYGTNHRNIVFGLRKVGKILAITDRQAKADEFAGRASLINGKTEKYVFSNPSLMNRILRIDKISSGRINTLEFDGKFNAEIARRIAETVPTVQNNFLFKKIVVNVLVDEDGNVIEAKIMGETKKAKEIEEATMKATFRPFVYKGVAQKMRGTISYFFAE